MARGHRGQIERATHVDYKGHVDRFIFPDLGQEKLSNLGRAELRAFEDKLRKTCSEAMVRKVLTTFGTLVADARSAASWPAM